MHNPKSQNYADKDPGILSDSVIFYCHFVLRSCMVVLSLEMNPRWISETLRESKAPVEVLDVGLNQCLNRVKTDEERQHYHHIAINREIVCKNCAIP